VSGSADALEPTTTNAAFDSVHWAPRLTLRKYRGDWTPEQIASGESGAPYEVQEVDGNLLTYGGASLLWECLIGNGTATAAQALTYLSTAQARIGVGNSSTAAAATQTDLQGGSKTRKAIDAAPTHTDGTGASSNAQVQFVATFTTSDANHAWEEWGLFNASTGGRMLNRKVQSMGTKTVSDTWQATVTLAAS